MIIYGLGSCFIKELLKKTKPLPDEKFLQLAVDGPNVNWNVLDGLDEQLIKNGHTKTINIGSFALWSWCSSKWILQNRLEHR